MVLIGLDFDRNLKNLKRHDSTCTVCSINRKTEEGEQKVKDQDKLHFCSDNDTLSHRRVYNPSITYNLVSRSRASGRRARVTMEASCPLQAAEHSSVKLELSESTATSLNINVVIFVA